MNTFHAAANPHIDEFAAMSIGAEKQNIGMQ